MRTRLALWLTRNRDDLDLSASIKALRFLNGLAGRCSVTASASSRMEIHSVASSRAMGSSSAQAATLIVGGFLGLRCLFGLTASFTAAALLCLLRH